MAPAAGTEIRAVGFDYTGVLANLPPGDIFEQIAHLTHSDCGSVQAARARLPLINGPVLTFVDQLRNSGYKVGLLTNLAAPTPWSEDLYARGIDRHFDAVGLSGETGLVKPEPAAFKWLSEHLNVPLHELVFTDDRPSALTGAAELGLHTVVYQNLPQLQAELRALGIEWDRNQSH